MSLLKAIVVTACTLVVSGCSTTDWRTTPRRVDSHFGQSVRHMIANQTMYPEHTMQRQDVLTLDGQRGQGIMPSYRAPATDLREAKNPTKIDIDSGGN